VAVPKVFTGRVVSIPHGKKGKYRKERTVLKFSQDQYWGDPNGGYFADAAPRIGGRYLTNAKKNHLESKIFRENPGPMDRKKSSRQIVEKEVGGWGSKVAGRSRERHLRFTEDHGGRVTQTSWDHTILPGWKRQGEKTLRD